MFNGHLCGVEGTVCLEKPLRRVEDRVPVLSCCTNTGYVLLDLWKGEMLVQGTGRQEAPWSRGPLVKSLQQSSFLGLPASDIVCRLGVTSFPPVTGMQDWTCLSFHLSLTFSCLDECSHHSPIALREETSNATPSAGNTRGSCPHGLLMWGKLKPPRACRHFMRSFCVSPVKFDAVLHTLNSSHNTV